MAGWQVINRSACQAYPSLRHDPLTLRLSYKKMINSKTVINPTAINRLKKSIDLRFRYLALHETRKAAAKLKINIRAAFKGSGLGNLGNAIASGSDQQKHGRVFERGGGRWSASGWVYIRSKSERTIGAITSYTKGATISPRYGRWLWLATPDLKRVVGLPAGDSKGQKKARLEPHLWDRTYGRTLGSLVTIKSVNGRPIMIIKNPAFVSSSGKRGTIRGALKNGRAPKGTVKKDFIVAFIAIPNTVRAQRVDVAALAKDVASQLPSSIGTGLKGSLKIGR